MKYENGLLWINDSATNATGWPIWLVGAVICTAVMLVLGLVLPDDLRIRIRPYAFTAYLASCLVFAVMWWCR